MIAHLRNLILTCSYFGSLTLLSLSCATTSYATLTETISDLSSDVQTKEEYWGHRLSLYLDTDPEIQSDLDEGGQILEKEIEARLGPTVSKSSTGKQTVESTKKNSFLMYALYSERSKAIWSFIQGRLSLIKTVAETQIDKNRETGDVSPQVKKLLESFLQELSRSLWKGLNTLRDETSTTLSVQHPALFAVVLGGEATLTIKKPLTGGQMPSYEAYQDVQAIVERVRKDQNVLPILDTFGPHSEGESEKRFHILQDNRRWALVEDDFITMVKVFNHLLPYLGEVKENSTLLNPHIEILLDQENNFTYDRIDHSLGIRLSSLMQKIGFLSATAGPKQSRLETLRKAASVGSITRSNEPDLINWKGVSLEKSYEEILRQDRTVQNRILKKASRLKESPECTASAAKSAPASSPASELTGQQKKENPSFCNVAASLVSIQGPAHAHHHIAHALSVSTEPHSAEATVTPPVRPPGRDRTFRTLMAPEPRIHDTNRILLKNEESIKVFLASQRFSGGLVYNSDLDQFVKDIGSPPGKSRGNGTQREYLFPVFVKGARTGTRRFTIDIAHNGRTPIGRGTIKHFLGRALKDCGLYDVIDIAK